MLAIERNVDKGIASIKSDFANFYLNFRIYSKRCDTYLAKFSKSSGCRFCSGRAEEYLRNGDRLAVNPTDCKWAVLFCARKWLTIQFIEKMVHKEYEDSSKKDKGSYREVL